MKKSRIVPLAMLLPALLAAACGERAGAQERLPAWEYAEMGMIRYADGDGNTDSWWWEEGSAPQVKGKSLDELGAALGRTGKTEHTTALVNHQASKGWEFVDFERAAWGRAVAGVWGGAGYVRSEMHYDSFAEDRWMFRRPRR